MQYELSPTPLFTMLLWIGPGVLLVLWLLSRSGVLTLTGVWIVFSLDLVTQAVIFTRLHRRGQWLEARV